jgi:micrococcal nuclease
VKILLIVSVIALLAVAGYAFVRARAPGATLSGPVSYVIDGDTIVVRTGGSGSVHVRLIGINTPEIAHYGKAGECYGIRASAITRRLALGRQVVLEVGRERHDRYGRLLAYVQVVGGPADLERTLLARGAARTLAIAPNIDRAALYDRLERGAQRARRGLWGACP